MGARFSHWCCGLRGVLKAAAACSFAALALGVAQAQEIVTDLAGRSVRTPAKVERILLGEGRLLPLLAILERDDVMRRLVGLPADFEKLDPAGYAQYAQRFPALDQVPRTGRTTGESFSVEKAIALQPDLAIFGLGGHGPSPKDREALARLHAAGVSVVFIDIRQEPLQNTVPSVELLGKVLGRTRQAAEFVGVYRTEMARVTDRLARAKPRWPSVFLENRVGMSEECCDTMTNGLMGRLVEAAGGRNIASSLVPGAFGTLSLEYLLSHPPEVYIGTAIGSAQSVARTPNLVVLGAGVPVGVAQASLVRATQRQGIKHLATFKTPRVHGIWHHFYTSPLHVAAVQAMAQWLHPQLFADLNPQATLQMLYQRFQPIPFNGQYWVSLEAAR